MSRQSPAVERIVAILNFFIEHSQGAFTLTQVAKSLRLSRATTLSILLGLVEAGYLYRRPDKTYVFGPVLQALAVGAHPPLPPLAVASQEMRTLADELDVVASALVMEGDEIVVQERAASVNHLGGASPAQRYPVSPAGGAFLIPLGDQEIAVKLDRLKPPLTEDERDDLLAGIAFARRHHYIALLAAEDEGEGRDRPRPGGRFVSSLDPAAAYRLRFVGAPVMEAAGVATLAISLSGFRTTMTGAQVEATGRRLLETCGRISAFITAGRFDPET